MGAAAPFGFWFATRSDAGGTDGAVGFAVWTDVPRLMGEEPVGNRSAWLAVERAAGDAARVGSVRRRTGGVKLGGIGDAVSEAEAVEAGKDAGEGAIEGDTEGDAGAACAAGAADEAADAAGDAGDAGDAGAAEAVPRRREPAGMKLGGVPCGRCPSLSCAMSPPEQYQNLCHCCT